MAYTRTTRKARREAFLSENTSRVIPPLQKARDWSERLAEKVKAFPLRRLNTFIESKKHNARKVYQQLLTATPATKRYEQLAQSFATLKEIRRIGVAEAKRRSVLACRRPGASICRKQRKENQDVDHA